MKKIASAIIAMAAALSLCGQGVAMAVTPTVEYTFESAEEGISAVPDNALSLTNGAVNGKTITGVKEVKHYDETKNKEVRRFNFDAKKYGENTSGSTDVRASLDGFKQFMTDPKINTISMDYKITGDSDSHIGLFLGKNVNDYGGVLNTGIVLNNTQGILLCAKANWNQGYSDWYGRAKYASQQQALPNNREWNRLTFEVDKQTGTVTAYINGEKFTVCPSTASNANPPKDMDSICFQTAGAVEKDGDLAILFDNIKVYPGKSKYTTGDVAVEGKWSFANGLEMENFGLCTSDGEIIYDIQPDVCVKTKLSNASENPIKVMVFVSGYIDGMLSSADFKMCEIDADGEFDISNTNNKMFLDSGKEYDSIQLGILDGVNGFPLIESRELKSAE